MNLVLLLKMVWRRVTRFKLKSTFMMLGIVISVLATVVLRTVGTNVRDAFIDFVRSMYSSDVIMMVAGSGPMGGGEGRASLMLDDVRAVANSISAITAWEPLVVTGYKEVKHKGANLQASLSSASDQTRFVQSRGVQAGDFFSADEVRAKARVALLGPKTAEELFGNRAPIGETFFIDNVPFTVKGVLDEAGFDPHGRDLDYAIQIPYTTLLAQLKVNYVGGARFLVDDAGRIDEIRDEIIQIMREQHSIVEGQEDDFALFTARAMLARVRNTWRVFDLFLPLTITVAFLVSGIVILSIMLITVRERTPEIGLRKAVGARPADLKLQFLLEVSLLSTVGAAIGVVLALPVTRQLTPILKEKFGAADLTPPVGVVALSVLGAIAVGVLAGYLPAVRAAKMNPIDAIR